MRSILNALTNLWGSCESAIPGSRFSFFSVDRLDPHHLCEMPRDVFFSKFHTFTALEPENYVS